MKTRQGFVSNSSSSSFILLTSGRIFSGMDMCASDLGLFQCVEGHCIEEGFFKYENDYEIIKSRGYEEFSAFIRERVFNDGEPYYPEIVNALPEAKADWDGFWDEYGEQIWEDAADGGSTIPAYCCPICELEVPINDVALLYLLGKNHTTLEEIRVKAKAEYGNLSGMQEALSHIEIVKYRDV